MTKQQRHMASIVRAIHAGKWTCEAPDWAGSVLQIVERFDVFEVPDVVRAVHTAEAFMMVALAEDSTFDSRAFLKACNLVR